MVAKIASARSTANASFRTRLPSYAARAMAAGVCGKLWSLEDVVTKIDVLAPLRKRPADRKSEISSETLPGRLQRQLGGS